MAKCDICSKEIEKMDGHLLTTMQVVSNPDYWQYLFENDMSYMEGAENEAEFKGDFAKLQAGQVCPWIVCKQHATMLGVNLIQTNNYARQWWDSEQAFVPPGSGAVPLSAVKFPQTEESTLDGEIPKPSIAYLFGRGFKPDRSDIFPAVRYLVERNSDVLTVDHFAEILFHLETEPDSARHIFLEVVDHIKEKHSQNYCIDVCLLDNKNGKDMVMMAVWEGSSAEIARRKLQKNNTYSASVEKHKKWWKFW